MKKITGNPDKDLVSALKQDDPKAFDELFRQYGPVLYRFAWSILKNRSDSEEVVQVVFCKIWERRKKLEPRLSFKSYLFTIALNIAKKAFRDRFRDQKYKQELAIELTVDANADLSEKEYQNLLDYVDRLIQMLPAGQREIFLLSKKEGLKNAEIAGKLKISEQTVKNQLVRAKAFILSKARSGKDFFQLLLFLFTRVDLS